MTELVGAPNMYQGQGKTVWNAAEQNSYAGTVDLHKSANLNYLFVDGHASLLGLSSEEVLGHAGTLNGPQGIWTFDPND